MHVTKKIPGAILVKLVARLVFEDCLTFESD